MVSTGGFEPLYNFLFIVNCRSVFTVLRSAVRHDATRDGFVPQDLDLLPAVIAETNDLDPDALQRLDGLKK